MPTSPLQQVKKLYGSKEKLVDEVAGLFAPAEGESADDFRKRLKHVANAKLLRLAKIGAAVKEIGGRDALIAKVAELSGLAKDKDFVTKIGSYADPKLLELHRSLSRKAKAKAAKSAS
ncbi:MAG: hypothetical protein R3A79_21410 [Nannocystaceae bacterium]